MSIVEWLLALAHSPGLWCSSSGLKSLQGKAKLPVFFPQSSRDNVTLTWDEQRTIQIEEELEGWGP